MPKNIPGIGSVFTVREIMKSLDVSESTVLRRYRDGSLKGQRFGKNIYFTDASLKDFLEGRTDRIPLVHNQREQAPDNEPMPLFKGGPTSKELEDQHEKRQIEIAMEQAGGYRQKAAEMLGISRVTLGKRLKKYGLKYPGNRGKGIKSARMK